MDIQKKEKLIEELVFFHYKFYNPKKGKKNKIVQFAFHEDNQTYYYYLKIENKKCFYHKGKSNTFNYQINTDLDTWLKIATGELKGQAAMKSGKLKIEGSLFDFLFHFGSAFGGTHHFEIPEGLFLKSEKPNQYKKILIISGSPRGKRGATGLMVDTFKEGLLRGGAEVVVLESAKMNINPCIGCLKCWSGESQGCVFDEKDQMKEVWKKYYWSDLIIWAAPVYVFHLPVAIKKVMDRLFVLNDPHIVLNQHNVTVHPKKTNQYKPMGVIAVAGYSGKENFSAIHHSFKVWRHHYDFDYPVELFRTQAMTFLSNADLQNVKQKSCLKALEQAGYELVTTKKIN
ncbi:MAG: NAD(P)H-dependent oxidoreductase, partial [Spirochaetes bacterium]|nr:NAD(P)H-dependent oxidoreductase [Spirochaetota bacterium]